MKGCGVRLGLMLRLCDRFDCANANGTDNGGGGKLGESEQQGPAADAQMAGNTNRDSEELEGG